MKGSIKHVKAGSGGGLFPPQDLSLAGARTGLFMQFPYSGEGTNSSSTPQKASYGKHKKKKE